MASGASSTSTCWRSRPTGAGWTTSRRPDRCRASTTRWIDDPQISDVKRGKHVQFWADTRTTGGTAIDAEGNIYASDPDKVQLLKIDPTGKISTFVADPRMLFVDEMWIDEKGFLWMPAVQLDRVLKKGGPPPQLPFHVLKVQTGQKPVHR